MFVSRLIIGRITDRSECIRRQVTAAGDAVLQPARISDTFALFGVWVVIGKGNLVESVVVPAAVEVREFFCLGVRLERCNSNVDVGAC